MSKDLCENSFSKPFLITALIKLLVSFRTPVHSLPGTGFYPVAEYISGAPGPLIYQSPGFPTPLFIGNNYISHNYSAAPNPPNNPSPGQKLQTLSRSPNDATAMKLNNKSVVYIQHGPFGGIRTLLPLTRRSQSSTKAASDETDGNQISQYLNPPYLNRLDIDIINSPPGIRQQEEANLPGPPSGGWAISSPEVGWGWGGGSGYSAAINNDDTTSTTTTTSVPESRNQVSSTPTTTTSTSQSTTSEGSGKGTISRSAAGPSASTGSNITLPDSGPENTVAKFRRIVSQIREIARRELRSG